MNQTIGKKGYEQGIIYFPYIMEQTNSKMVEGSFAPKMSIRSRYADATVNGNFLEFKITPKQKTSKQIFSDIDPYGEENWED